MSTPGIPGFEEVSALATKYSPEQLQRMAASGMIDISMATRAKFLQQRIASAVAQSQAPQTTVAQDVMQGPQSAPQAGIEQLAAMQQAQAGAPQMPQEQGPQAAGLDALPINEGEYAAGGIVAFEDGGNVTGIDQDFLDATGLSEADFGGGAFRYNPEEMRRILFEKALAKPEKTQAEKDYIDYLSGSADRQKAAREYATGVELPLTVAGKLLESKSPHWSRALGESISAATPALAASKKAQTAAEAGDLKARAELAKGERTDELKRQELAGKMYGYEREMERARLSADKPTDWQRRYDSFLPGVMAELGTDDPNDPRVRAKTARAVDESIGLQSAKVGVSQAEAATAATKAQTDRNKAFGEWWQDSQYDKEWRDQVRAARQKDQQYRKDNPGATDSPNMAALRERARAAWDKSNPVAQAVTTPVPNQAGSTGQKQKTAAAQPEINVGNDITSKRLTGAELKQKIAALGDHPNKDALAARMTEAETRYKKQIASAKAVPVKSQADFDNLPEGTVYILPDGTKGIRGPKNENSTPASGAAGKTPPPPPGFVTR